MQRMLTTLCQMLTLCIYKIECLNAGLGIVWKERSVENLNHSSRTHFKEKIKIKGRLI